MPDHSIEDIIMSDSSRGMDKLRPHLPDDYCMRAARALYALERGSVLLTTGFYVAGHPETDGPLGTYFLARALNTLGFNCTIVTDCCCAGLFEHFGCKVEYIGIDDGAQICASLLDRYRPKALISVERCGINAKGDYANMRGESIACYTAKLDPLFEEGARRKIPSFGIGDGGNEIGMGCFKHIIQKELSLSPCVTRVDYPVIATVSNWGGYGLCACLSQLAGLSLLPNPEEVESVLHRMVEAGCVDGVTRLHTPTVDSMAAGSEAQIMIRLAKFKK